MPKAHGHCCKRSTSPTYNSWKMMCQRCYNAAREDYKDYGGKGVRVYFDWVGPGGFAQFLADVGERPGPEYVLGRVDHDKDYEPGNVGWELKAVNCRVISRNPGPEVTVDGVTKTVKSWAEWLGIKRDSLMQRLRRGWKEDAYRIPKGSGRRK